MKKALAVVSKLLRILRTRDARCYSALRQGVAAGVEHIPVLEQLAEAPFDVVVDVGANRGQFALAVRHCLPSARILSFEPLPGPANTFRKIFADDPNTVLQEVAVGPSSGRVTMHVSKSDDSSSLLAINPTQTQLFPRTAEAYTTKVTVKPLSEVLSLSDLGLRNMLKVDVQGFELGVLKGCGPLLKRFSHAYIECSFMELYDEQAMAHDIIRYLSAREFQLIGVFNLSVDPSARPLQADFLFQQSVRDTHTLPSTLASGVSVSHNIVF